MAARSATTGRANSFVGPVVFGVEADIQGTGMRDKYAA